MNDIHFSLILPTRGRPGLLTRFLDSLRDTTIHPDRIEVLIVADADDATMQGFAYGALSCRVIEVAPGLSMGSLNMAGYRASRGDYMFLVNDDMIARTPGWDVRMHEEFRRFPDGIALCHVNDLLFESHLCTFPCVTRTFCELMGGICPEEYHRHRIDDHVYSLFNMLAFLGEKRIAYLPDVVFEHDHYVLNDQGKREYAASGAIHQPDADFFENSFAARKQQTLRLMDHARAHRGQERASVLQARLDELPDSMGIRHPQYVEVRTAGTRPSSADTRVTIGVCSAGHTGEVPARCLEAIRQHTANYELLLLDNNRFPGFNHARDMNRIMEACSTKYLVLMDDDVIVEPGWLDALLSCMDTDTGVVTPAHTDRDGDISYCGVLFRPDRSGHHGHLFERPDRPTPIMTMTSAILLVDMDKCGRLRFDETMPKYFLDLDYGLRVWEAGYRLMLAPQVPVCHIGGATLNYGSEGNLQKWEVHRRVFERKWFATGRIDELAATRHAAEPEVSRLWRLLDRVNGILDMLPGETCEAYAARARAVYEEYRAIPVLNQYVVDKVWTAVKAQGGIGNGLEQGKWPLAYLSSLYGRQIFTGEHGDYATYFFAEAFWAVPKAYAPLFIRSLTRMNRPGLFSAPTHAALCRTIDERGPHTPQRPEDGGVVEEHPQGVVVSFDNRFMACPPGRPGIPLVSGGTFYGQDSARSCLFMEEPQFIEERGGHTVYKFHHMYYAAPGLTPQDFATGSDRVRNALRAFTTSEIHHEMEFAASGADNGGNAARSLAIFCTLPPAAMAPFLRHAPQDVLLVHLPAHRADYAGCNALEVACQEGTHPDFDVMRVTQAWKDAFRERGIEAVLVPSRYPDTWEHNLPERLASALCGHVILLGEQGDRRSFSGECAQRLQYNKANLCTVFKHVPMGEVATVLEVGCSDGLACELVAMVGAREIRGVDTSAVVNLVKTSDAVRLSRSTAQVLNFPDNAFDLVFSIAVMEHVDNPSRAFREMLRVTRPGGYCYVQTAPLYHSPWGHHMPYFKEPWVHLTHNADELIEYARRSGIAERIESELNIGAEHYIKGMLCPDHINGLTPLEFGFDEVAEECGVEVLFSARTHEGRDLLPEKMRARLWPYSFGELTDHGIQLLVRKPRG